MPSMNGFDAYDPGFLQNPYPTYRRLLEHEPVFHDESWGLTFFARHADVTGILRDRRFGRDIRHVLPMERIDQRTYPQHLPTWYRMIRGSFIDLEPPEHTRIRSSVARSFTRKRAEVKRETVAAAVGSLIDGLPDEADLIKELATPLPVAIIAEMMGVAPEHHQMLLDWSHAIVRVFDLNVTRTEEEAAERATVEFVDYLRDIIVRRRADGGNDLISELVHADDPLSDDDLIATCILVLNAGHEATVHGIGNSLLALARDPAAFERLRADRSLLPTAVDELLRFDPPLQMFERWVLEDLEWNGVTLDQGSKVGLLFGAANHDPAAFDTPEALDLSRDPNPHLSFGMGIHLCVGAPLARLELEEVLSAVTSRFRALTLIDSEPPRTPSLVFRGVDTLRASLIA